MHSLEMTRGHSRLARGLPGHNLQTACKPALCILAQYLRILGFEIAINTTTAIASLLSLHRFGGEGRGEGGPAALSDLRSSWPSP